MSHFGAHLPRKPSTLVIPHDHPRVLLGMKKRGFGTGRWNGFGGKVEEGETIEEAAKRELREEAGISALDLHQLGTLEFSLFGEEFIREVHVFKVSLWEGAFSESEEMRPQWFTVDEIPFGSMWPDDLHWFPFFLANRAFTGRASFDAAGVMFDFEFKERIGRRCFLKRYSSVMSILKSVHRFLYKIAYILLRAYWFAFRPHTKSVLALVLFGSGPGTEILLIRHTYDRKGWLFPGGSVRRRESSEDAIRREISEELNITISEVKPITSTDTIINYHYSHVDYYLLRPRSKDFRIDDVEIAEARWFPLSSLPDIMEGKEIVAQVR